MAEEMSEFFDKRVDGYEEHMLKTVDGADEYYKETAKVLGLKGSAQLLDLGCGTGLELDEIFKVSPWISATGVDLSIGMLAKLLAKPYASRLTLKRGSFFDVPFGTSKFDAAVSVEALHHYTGLQKKALYEKILSALVPGGRYVETDYVASNQAAEDDLKTDWKNERGDTPEDTFLHLDRPHTAENLTRIMQEAGFADAKVVWREKNTAIIVATKGK